MRLKRIIYTLIGLVLIALIVYLKPKKASDKHNSTISGKIPTLVNAYITGSESLEDKIYVTGTVLANNQVGLRSETSGKVVEVLFEEGKRVVRGQLLVKLNDADLQAQLQKLKYQEELANSREARQKKLLQAQGISQDEYDVTLNLLNTIRADIGFVMAQIDKTEIKAPFDGIIGLKYVYTGSYVSPSNEIASLQDINPVKVDFSVPEKYSGYLHEGDRIEFTIPGTAEIFEGKVYAIEPRVEELTRTIKMRAICPNTQGRILPGSFAKINLVINSIERTVMLPSQAIISGMKGQRVYLYKNGRAVMTDVRTGIRNESEIQISEGVESGDTVITSGLMQIRDGERVRIMNIE